MKPGRNLALEQTSLPPTSSAPIDQTYAALGAARAVAVAVQLGVFTRIAEGNNTVTAVALSAQASPRGIRALLNVLVALRFLTKSDDTYELAPVASDFLVRDKRFYMGRLMEDDWLWESWSHLAEAVRTGRPFRHVDKATDSAADFFKALIPTLYTANLPGARKAARVLLAGGQVPERVIDIGCGSAVWSIALAEAAGPRTRVTAQDLPGVLDLTREYLRLHGVEDRFDFLPGDQRKVDLGQGRFDLAIIARYAHELGVEEACDLFGRVYLALKPGGRIAIADWMPNRDRTGPVGPLIYSLRMLLHTEAGDAHTADQYTRWLRNLGFGDVTVTPDIGPDVPLVVGYKPK